MPTNKFSSENVPDFSYGARELNLSGQDERKELSSFIDSWFENPELFLNIEKLVNKKHFSEIGEIKDRDEQCFCFESFVDRSDTAKFYESRQPFYGRGEKIAFIILPHWNAYFYKYKLGTAVIRNFFLPVATYRYFPEYQTEQQYIGQPRFDIVGPNIGLTIKRFWQDILNVEHFAKHLKENLHYGKVGIWAYSIGSPRGYLASLFTEGYFDFLIMNFLADSFPQALLNGSSTQPISKKIREKLNDEEAEYFLSPLSPGRYIEYTERLPRCTRLVQSRQDLVFGPANSLKIADKIKKSAPFVEVEHGDFGHSAHKKINKLAPVIRRNSQLVFRNSSLRFLV